MRLVFLPLVFIAAAAAQEPQAGHMVSAYKTIGPVHREISDTSPVAKVVIEQIVRDPRILSPYKVAIGIKLYNIADHEINFQRNDTAFDVTDVKTGRRPPETSLGCAVDFFSQCYTSHAPRSEDNGYGKEPGLTIKPKEFVQMSELLDAYYKLTPGDYTVVWYHCSAKREGPECFKSNKIIIEVPPDTK